MQPTLNPDTLSRVMRPDRRRIEAALCGTWLLCMALPLLTGCSSRGDDPLSEIIEPFKAPTPGEAAREAFNVYDADTRRRSITLLAAAKFGGEEPYLRLYRLLVDDPDPTVRAACIKALGIHGKVDDSQILIDRLQDPATPVRWEAAKGLQRIHNPQAAAPLIDAMLKDEDPDVRMACAEALGQYAQPAVFNALISRLDDTDHGVVQTARQSLSTLTGYDFGVDASLWLIWAQRNERNLFEHQQPYTWRPFVRPPTMFEKMQFWKERTIPQPQAPRGLG